jgi:ketosteroid isomerase-like protein
MYDFAAAGKMLVLPLLTLAIASDGSQAPPASKSGDELFRTIAALDEALFASYNECDLAKFKSFFVDDVEFYHDQRGVTLGSQNLSEGIRKNICGKVRRELVPGTLEVHPMRGYGAVEIGVHRFHQPKTSGEPVGEAKFIHLWQNKDGAWKITRVISYDHRAIGRIGVTGMPTCLSPDHTTTKSRQVDFKKDNRSGRQ